MNNYNTNNCSNQYNKYRFHIPTHLQGRIKGLEESAQRHYVNNEQLTLFPTSYYSHGVSLPAGDRRYSDDTTPKLKEMQKKLSLSGWNNDP